MENQGMGSNDPFDDLMRELDAKAASAKKGERKEYVKPDLVKLFMNVPTNHGSFFIIPVNEAVSNRSITMLDSVMEMKLKIGNWDKTIRIAEKSVYSNLGEEGSKESILYDEISSMFLYLRKEGFDFNRLKYKSYSLMFAYVLSHFDLDATNIANKFPALFCIGEKGFRDTFRETMKSKIALTGGTKFMSDYFNRNFDGRSHLINLNYKRTTQYSSSLTYSPITSDYFGVTDSESTVKFNEEFLNTCFTNHVDKFFNLTDGVFDYDFNISVRDALKLEAEKFNKAKAIESSAPQETAATTLPPGVGPLN